MYLCITRWLTVTSSGRCLKRHIFSILCNLLLWWFCDQKLMFWKVNIHKAQPCRLWLWRESSPVDTEDVSLEQPFTLVSFEQYIYDIYTIIRHGSSLLQINKFRCSFTCQGIRFAFGYYHGCHLRIYTMGALLWVLVY